MTKKKKKSQPKENAKKSNSVTQGLPEKKTGLLGKVQAQVKATAKPGKSQFSRYVSFGLLLCVIGILCVIFYQVMSRFIIPLFLSALLVVIFRPLHEWIAKKIGGRVQIAALLTTLSILLAVLIPLAGLIFLAASEGRDVARQFNAAKVIDDISHIRTDLGLDMPSAREVRQVEKSIGSTFANIVSDSESLNKQSAALFEIQEETIAIARQQELPWPVEPAPVAGENEDANTFFGTSNESDKLLTWKKYARSLNQATKLHVDIEASVRKANAASSPEETSEINEEKHATAHLYQKTLGETSQAFLDFKYQMLGGRTKTMVIEAVNPTRTELQTYTEKAVTFLREKLFALGGSITTFLGSMIFGGVIMVIGVYFFLLDGPAMVETFKGLSPIDDDHEQELVSEFGRVSRAVVVATLLSALVQGLLAGIGFYFVGLDSIFLLTLLSAVLAMVPFVGAASVWIPCALYLYFFDNNLGGAIGLAIYGAVVISMADNIIKPWILHGQSNLHPLLALLSVLGGVAVLGPIGILIGPMIVAFLQTLLKIMHRELDILEQHSAEESPPPTVAEPSAPAAS